MSAPGWARQLAGVDPKAVTSRAALAKLPVLRKSDLLALQKEHPPFGGFNVIAARQGQAPASCRPGRSSSPRATARDFGGAARALFAAGFRAGRHRAQFVLLSSDARRLHPGGGRACARLRRDPRRHRQHRAAARRDRASTSPAATSARRISSRSCSTPRRRPARTPPRSSAGWSPARRCRPRCARSSRARGVAVLQCYATAELGVIAYESEALRGHDRQRER